MSRREWVLADWFAHVEMACARAGIDDFGVVVVVADGDPSVEVIEGFRRPVELVWSDETPRVDERCWQEDGRYVQLATVRNMLLAAVRRSEPDLFLSVDSDVLLHADAVSVMVDLVAGGRFGAVGSKTFLAPSGVAAPNYGHLLGWGGLLRPDSTAVLSVDVLMAIKLMTPAAYHVDYVADGVAEDIGWSNAARRAGVALGWTGAVCSKHVMTPAMLDVVDERCGF